METLLVFGRTIRKNRVNHEKKRQVNVIEQQHKTCCVVKITLLHLEKRKRRQRNLPPEIMRKLLEKALMNTALFATVDIQKKKRPLPWRRKHQCIFFPTKLMIISGRTAGLMRHSMVGVALLRKRMINHHFLK